MFPLKPKSARSAPAGRLAEPTDPLAIERGPVLVAVGFLSLEKRYGFMLEALAQAR